MRKTSRPAKIDSHSLTDVELAWLAGLLEGEGCFDTVKYKAGEGAKKIIARIQLNMTDKDVVERVAEMLSLTLCGPYETKGRKNSKPFWSVRVSGHNAAFWMRELLPLMSSRRQEKIEEVLAAHGTIGYADNPFMK